MNIRLHQKEIIKGNNHNHMNIRLNQKEIKNKNVMSRNFSHLVIPREIWLRRDISLQAKCLWAELWSLHDREQGGCYASVEYLCEFLGIKKRRYYDLQKELKDKNLVELVHNDGRKRIIKAIVPETDYGPGLNDLEPEVFDNQDRTTEVQKTAQPECRKLHTSTDLNICNIYKEENKEYKSCAKAQPPTPSIIKKRIIKKTKPEKIERAEDIFVSDEDHQKLVTKHGEGLTNRAYQEISLWKRMKGEKYKCDYAACLKWGINAAKERLQKEEPENMVKENKAFAAAIKRSFDQTYQKSTVSVEVGANGFEIIPHGSYSPTVIAYKEHGFVEQIKNLLRKYGYPIK